MPIAVRPVAFGDVFGHVWKRISPHLKPLIAIHLIILLVATLFGLIALKVASNFGETSGLLVQLFFSLIANLIFAFVGVGLMRICMKVCRNQELGDSKAQLLSGADKFLAAFGSAYHRKSDPCDGFISVVFTLAGIRLFLLAHSLFGRRQPIQLACLVSIVSEIGQAKHGEQFFAGDCRRRSHRPGCNYVRYWALDHIAFCQLAYGDGLFGDGRSNLVLYRHLVFGCQCLTLA